MPALMKVEEVVVPEMGPAQVTELPWTSMVPPDEPTVMPRLGSLAKKLALNCHVPPSRVTWSERRPPVVGLMGSPPRPFTFHVPSLMMRLPVQRVLATVEEAKNVPLPSLVRLPEPWKPLVGL